MHESDVKDKLEKELAMLLSGHCLNDMVNPLLGMPGESAPFILCLRLK